MYVYKMIVYRNLILALCLLFFFFITNLKSYIMLIQEMNFVR